MSSIARQISLFAIVVAALLLLLVAGGAGRAPLAPTAEAAPSPPFSLSPAALSFSPGPRVGGFAYADVTVTTGRRTIVIQSPASFGAASPFFDTQAGTCWQNYGALGNKLPKLSSCTIEVGFNPASAGSFSDTMTVYMCKKWHLDGGGGIACDTLDGSQTIGVSGQTCTPGAPGCGWETGDVITYHQAAWSDDIVASTLLSAFYQTVYASTFGVLEAGIPGSGGFSILFSGATQVVAYLPAVGPDGPLTSDLVDPTSTSAGAFGGDVVALKLNVDFSDAGFTLGAANAQFGDLRVCGVSGVSGLRVRDVLAIGHTLLGGGSSSITIGDFVPVIVSLNEAFAGGAVSTFAQQHLVNGACP